jgi:hypothetical protein
MTLPVQQIRQEDVALSIAVAPNIFDVYFDTNLIGTLCLANLLSSALWAFSEKVQVQVDAILTEPTSEIPASIRLIQKYLNKSFTHLHPAEVASVYGLVDLSLERARFDGPSFDEAVRGLETCFLEFRKQGGVLETAGDQVISWMHDGKFPSYAYTNFDLIKAHKNLTGRSTKSPSGLTSCLDEVALFIALAITIPRPGDVRAMMVMSSVSHYGAFGYAEDGRSWWFNGKNQLYSKREWDCLVAEQYEGNHQACFDQMFSNFSQMTTVSGLFDCSSGQSSIPDEYLDEYLQAMASFFGITLRQVVEGLKNKQTSRPESDHANFFRQLLGLGSREHLLNQLQSTTALWAEKAFYAYRSLQVESLMPYLLNARRNPLARVAARNARGIDDIVAIVRSLSGTSSIFNERERIAMPDETLRLKTGTDRDKALLLHVLLEHYMQTNQLQHEVRSAYTHNESFVMVAGTWLAMTNLQPWDAELPTDIKYRL